mmetsp:Transcript_11885/g.27881  ORF Transcript_11885/g.27881 Transcript_11885/m.27881 type:complete len:280 (-) Transcript_11885:87-926(-)
MRVTLASIGLLFTPISSGHAWTAGQPLTSAASDVAPRRRHLSPAAVGDGRHLGGRRIGRGGGLEMTIDLDSPIVKSLIPKLGVVTSTALYFSPLMAVLNAKMSGDIGDLNPIPLTIMAISSVCWLAYGLSIQDPYVTISNVPGAVATIWYIVSILPLLASNQLVIAQRILVTLSAVTINLWTYLSLTKKPLGEIQRCLGKYASGLFIILSLSPLGTIRKVFSTRSSKSVLAPLTAAQVGNTALWSAYGLAIKDRFVYGPNLAGLCFGLIQLFLKVLFPS